MAFFFCSFSCLIVDGFWNVLSDFPRLVDHQRRKRFGRGQMLHRGAHSEVRAGLIDAVRWGLLGSLVGSLFQTPVHSQLLGWFLLGLGSPGCNLGGRERGGTTNSSSSPGLSTAWWSERVNFRRRRWLLPPVLWKRKVKNHVWGGSSSLFVLSRHLFPRE